MRRSYIFFNLACLAVAGLFALGLVWVWKSWPANTEQYVWQPPDDRHIVRQDPPEAIPELDPKPDAEDGPTSTPPVTFPEPTTPTTSAGTMRVTRDATSLLTGTLELTERDINLAVPYTSQAPERNWDQPWQDACEEAALLMLDAYYKGYNLSPLFAKDELQKMIAWEQERGWGGSISIDNVKEIAEQYLKISRPVHIVENPTVEQIKNYVATGHPVLVVADGKILPNPYYSNGGPVYHALIIRGFTEDKFITNDPGVNRGANFVFKIPDLMESIRDWNGGDVKRGRRAILVVE